MASDPSLRGTVTVRPAECDVNRIAGRVVGALRPVALTRRLSFLVETSGDTRASVDPELIERALGCLLDVAFRFARSGPVSLRIDGTSRDAIVVRIGHDGVEASADDLAVAFCRQVLDAHGGGLHVESANEDRVVFAAELPRTGPVAGKERGG